MDINNYKNLLKHSFWGNFDTGVINIFLSLHIWTKTENMLTIAIAFIIPILINTVIDYFFSNLSDRSKRVRLIIIGNIGSSLFLSLYGLAQNVYLLYLFIFLKSLFEKLYLSSLSPFKRENISEDEYRAYVAKENERVSIGASIGGFSLMGLYMFVESIPLIFAISGLVELFSTVYLLKLKNNQIVRSKENEEPVDLDWLKRITVVYTIQAFGAALIVNRMMIFLYDVHWVQTAEIGFIFFIVYGLTTIIAARIHHKFKKITLKNMLIVSFILQAIMLFTVTMTNRLFIVIISWFIFELVSGIASIYSSDRINKSLFTNIGRRLSKFRISISIGSVLGQLMISQIWDRVGINQSFFFSGIILIALSLFIVFYMDKQVLDNKGLLG